jgi:hypothetical protein
MKLFSLSANEWLQILLLPLSFAAVGVLAKKLGRRDGDDSPHINDWAIGTSVVLMTFGKIMADLIDSRGNPVPPTLVGISSEIHWELLGIILVIFIFLNHDRFTSWVKNAEGKPDKWKRRFVGVIFPDLVSILIFACYQARKVGIL